MRNSMKMSILGNFAAIFLAAILFIGLALSQIAEAGVATIKNVRITNVRGTQFSVSWTGDASEIGYVRYKDSLAGNDSWQNAFDDRGVSTSDDIHHVTVKGLTPVYDVYKRNTSGDLVDSAGNLLKANDSYTNIVVESAVTPVYYFKIISGTAVDDNDSHYFRVDPGPAIVQAGSCQPAGKVYLDQDMTPVTGAIAYAAILGATENLNSATESMIVSDDTLRNGHWFFDLVNFRTKDFYDSYAYACNDSNIRIEIQGASRGAAQLFTKAIDYTTAERANIILSGDDTVAPGPVTSLNATISEAVEREAVLSWLNPGDADLAGVLIVVREGAAPTATPENGTSYISGVNIGDGKIGFVGTKTDVNAKIGALKAGVVHYFKAYAFDNAFNYSTLAGPVNATPYENDTDNDGMPDWWENQYGLNANASNAGDDPDADGFTNIFEYENGLNPSLADGFWQTTINAVGEDVGGVKEYLVTFGVDAQATLKPAAPAPISYSVKMALYLSDWLEAYSKDIKATGATSYSWIITINPHGNILPSDARSATLSWDPNTLSPFGTFRLREGYDGSGQIKVANMRNISSYVVTGENSDQAFTVEWGMATPVEMNLVQGWNLISLPVIPTDSSLSALFPDAIVAYKFDTYYQEVTSLEPGKGYWIKVPSTTTYTITGAAFTNYTETLTAGWHLKGAVSTTSTPTTNPANKISVMYGFGSYYIEANEFVPGKGYWVKILEQSAFTVD